MLVLEISPCTALGINLPGPGSPPSHLLGPCCCEQASLSYASHLSLATQLDREGPFVVGALQIPPLEGREYLLFPFLGWRT